MRPAHQNNRRTFRGRGGPTDGRLPPPKLPRVRRKYDAGANTTTFTGSAAVLPEDEDVPPRIVGSETQEKNESHESVKEIAGADAATDEASSNFQQQQQQQLQHLHHRIRHNQTAMSQTTVAHLEHYQTHVLAATRNTLREWQALRRSTSDPEQPLDTTLTPQLFGLVQQALQTGPLQGGKPGYCKRCGSAVANVVAEFLNDVILCEGWSERQRKALQQWQRNADKAAASTETGPSKSVQKRMQRVSKKKKSKAKNGA